MSSRLMSVALLCTVLVGCGGGGGFVPAPPLPPTPTAGAQAAQIGVDVLVGDTSTVFQFFGQSSDAEGGAVDYEWDFDGDGAADATVQSPQHTFASTGEKTVRLTVTDDTGRVSSAEAVVGVFDAPDPAAPAVTVRTWISNGTAPCQVICHANAEDPDGGAITSYAWDFDGDGTPDATGASPTVVTLFPDAGSIEVVVTAMDDEGSESDAKATLVLCDPSAYPDGPPSAMIVAPGGTLVTPTNTPLALAALGSDLDGGAVATVAWDLDDDGTFDDATGRMIDATFAVEGTYRVRVRLTDEEGNAPHEAEVRVAVRDPGGPVRPSVPSAWVWAETLVVVPGTDVQFHGLGEEPDGQVLTYSWDVDGDGVEDASTPDPLLSFALPGIYRPRLSVEDQDGNVSTSDMTLLVEICEDTSAPYFRYAGEDLVLLHGGAPQWPLTPAAGAGAPTSYQLLYKAGPPAEDPSAGDLDVGAHTGPQLPPATALIAVPAGGDVPLDLLSYAVDGPPRLTCYTVGVRLVDPGVRVQVLTCQACVVHDVVVAGFPLVFSLTDDYQCQMSVQVDPTLVPGLQAVLPDVYEVQLVFGDQEPALLEVTALGLQPPSWSEEVLADRYRLYTTTNPIPPDASVYSWQFRYDTNAGPGRGLPLTAARIRLLDENGVLLGEQGVALP